MGIVFQGNIREIGMNMVLRLPREASDKLPSRGLVMVKGTINGAAFLAPLEPDGRGGHFLFMSDKLMELTHAAQGQSAALEIEPAEVWPEPEIPEDVLVAIEKAGLTERWNSITTKARWEWHRWIRATKNPATRQKRIEVACSKLKKGDNRPCCFNAASCTIMEVSKAGVLADADA